MIPISPVTQPIQPHRPANSALVGLPRQERFGVLGTGVMQRMLQPIAENYLAGFMAQDVFSLWLPRIGGSLERGRIEYDAKQDPMAKQRTPMDQYWHKLKQNAKGLNYWNGWEETAREIQSGPGFMLWGILIFGVGMANMLGKRSLLMSYKEVKTYWQMMKSVFKPAVIEQLPRLGLQKQHDLLMSAHLKNALGHFFNAETLAQPIAIKPAGQGMIGESEKHFWTWMRSLAAGKESATVEKALDHWMNDYVAVLGQPQKHRKLAKQLVPLEQKFEELVYWVNTHHKGVTDPTQLTKLALPNAQLPITSTEAQEMLHATEKLSSGLKDLLHRQGQQGLPKTPEAWDQHINRFARKVIDLKLPLCIGATLMGGINHFYVSAISQFKDRHYPANRLIPIDNLGVKHNKALPVPSALQHKGGRPVA